MIGQGLSLQQSPPFASSFRFFIFYPIFSIFLSISLFLSADVLFYSRWSFTTIGVLHFVTIGIISMIMLGALLQMLPVLAGKPVLKAKITSVVTHSLILIGVLNLSFGFILEMPILWKFALGFLSAGFYIYTFVLLFSMRIKKVNNDISTNTIRAMKASLISLIMNVTFGVILLSGFLWGFPFLERDLIIKIHYIFGLVGWMSILLVGVSFQVIPMFYVTHNYSKWFEKNIIRFLFSLLFIEMTIIFIGYYYPFSLYTTLIKTIESIIVLLLVYFAIESLKIIKFRKKKFPDITVRFWQTGLTSLIVGSIFLFLSLFDIKIFSYSFKGSYTWILFFLFGVLIPIINGMLYKIVPFLVWFHLFSKGLSNVPNMKQILPEKNAKIQFYLYILFFIVLLIGTLFKLNIILPYTGLILGVSTILFLYNIIKAALIYHNFIHNK